MQAKIGEFRCKSVKNQACALSDVLLSKGLLFDSWFFAKVRNNF